MTSFEDVLSRLSRLLDGAGIPYMVIGGQAVAIHGEPRLTLDVDVTLGAGVERFTEIAAALKEGGFRPLPEKPEEFARQTMVLPMMSPPPARRVDIVFSDTPYEREAISRAVNRKIAGAEVRFASAEDLLVQKLVAGRPRDLEDAHGVWLRCKSKLDFAYIERWLKDFAAVPGLEDLQERWRLARDG